MSDRVFSALLKYWRNRHGLSQLDLALQSGVSSRHISFLETGRAAPSTEMVLRLMAALEVPLRDQNEALRHAGHPPFFPETEWNEMPAAVSWAIDRMLAQQEPFPMTVLSPDYTVLKHNFAAKQIFQRFVAVPARVSRPFDMFSLLFDPAMAKHFVANWNEVARHMLSRLHREALQLPSKPNLTQLIERVMQYPDVKKEWRQPDFSTPVESTLSVRLLRDEVALSFMTTVTVFSSPRLVTLEELMIESYFPLDDETKQFCIDLSNG